MADKSALGAKGEPFQVPIERGKIAEFARAIHAEHPAYTGDAPVSPPTFLTTGTFFWEEESPWPRVNMDQQRGLHAEQEYVFHGPPPRAGTTLTGRSEVTEMYEKEGRRGGTMTFVVMTTEFRDGEGNLVAEARMTGVETAKPPTEES